MVVGNSGLLSREAFDVAARVAESGRFASMDVKFFLGHVLPPLPYALLIAFANSTPDHSWLGLKLEPTSQRYVHGIRHIGSLLAKVTGHFLRCSMAESLSMNREEGHRLFSHDDCTTGQS
jgi:hypothetical protein